MKKIFLALLFLMMICSTNLHAGLHSHTYPDGSFRSSGTITSDQGFIGPGPSITGLDGNNISIGTVAEPRIASTIARDSEVAVATTSAVEPYLLKSSATITYVHQTLFSDTTAYLQSDINTKISLSSAAETYVHKSLLFSTTDAMKLEWTNDIAIATSSVNAIQLGGYTSSYFATNFSVADATSNINAAQLGSHTSDFFAISADVFIATHTNKGYIFDLWISTGGNKDAIALRLLESSATATYVNKNLLASTTAPYISSNTIASLYQRELSTPSWTAYNSFRLNGQTYDAFLSTTGDFAKGDYTFSGGTVTVSRLNLFYPSFSGYIQAGEDPGIEINAKGSIILYSVSADYSYPSFFTGDQETHMNTNFIVRPKYQQYGNIFPNLSFYIEDNGEPTLDFQPDSTHSARISYSSTTAQIIHSTHTKTEGDAEITGKAIVSTITTPGSQISFDNKNLGDINTMNAFEVHSDTITGGDSDNWSIPLWSKNVWARNFDPNTSDSWIQFIGNNADYWDGFWVGYNSTTVSGVLGGARGELVAENCYIRLRITGDKKFIVPWDNNQYLFGIDGNAFKEVNSYKVITSTISSKGNKIKMGDPMEFYKGTSLPTSGYPDGVSYYHTTENNLYISTETVVGVQSWKPVW